MTEETCKERLQVARLDRTQPPPGYVVRPDMRGAFGPHPTGPGYEFACGNLTRGSYDAEVEAVADAWAHYEREHDPPGMVVWLDALAGDDVWWWGDENRNYGPEEREDVDARAAAWAWHWRRRALADRLDAEAAVLIEHLDGGGLRRVTTTRSRIVSALRPMLTMADDDDAHEETIAEVERLFSEGRLTFEGDQPIELENGDAWPAALAWPDEQVAAVERWLAEGGAPPEVIRG